MAGSAAQPAPPVRALPAALDVPDGTLLDAITAIAAAGSRHDVAEAVCRVLSEVDGVRAVAVTQRSGSGALIISSVGYGCETMAAGARLPLDSGLPVAEAIRTGSLIAQGPGPGWLAVPFGRLAATRGALLLSLTVAPTQEPAQLAMLDRLVRALDDALLRAAEHDRVEQELSCVLAGLTPRAALDEWSTAVRQTSCDAELGGDVLLVVPDGADGRWLLAADVCGSGLSAATGAMAVRTAARALMPLATGPAHLLGLLDGALRFEAPEGGFVTAVVAHARGGLLRVASAGHPAPLLLSGAGAVEIELRPDQPLALETTEGLPSPEEWTAEVPTGTFIVLYSDGLVERRGDAGDLDVRQLAAGISGTTPADVADALVSAADAVGPAADDTSVLVSRL